MGIPLPRRVRSPLVALALPLLLALLASAADPALGLQRADQQDRVPMLTGLVSADWRWEPAPVPTPPAASVAPEVIEKTVPGYPSAARTREGYQGHVIAEATIGVAGQIIEPRIVRSPAPDVFDETVLEALRQWSFRPATRGGVPVEVTGLFTFTFEIRVPEEAEPSAQGSRANAVQMGSGGLVAPRKLSSVLPEYTDSAKEAGIEGDVYIEAVVTKEGDIVEPKLIRGLPDDELNRRALEAILLWKFEPGRKDNRPVDVIALFTMTYRIH